MSASVRVFSETTQLKTNERQTVLISHTEAMPCSTNHQRQPKRNRKVREMISTTTVFVWLFAVICLRWSGIYSPWRAPLGLVKRINAIWDLCVEMLWMYLCNCWVKAGKFKEIPPIDDHDNYCDLRRFIKLRNI